ERNELPLARQEDPSADVVEELAADLRTDQVIVGRDLQRSGLAAADRRVAELIFELDVAETEAGRQDVPAPLQPIDLEAVQSRTQRELLERRAVEDRDVRVSQAVDRRHVGVEPRTDSGLASGPRIGGRHERRFPTVDAVAATTDRRSSA